MLRLPKGYEFSGDSPSLYNFTLSPGWTREEIEILRLALMKFGIGRWKEITDSGCLEGKTPSQLNNQTQRLLGQQAIAEFSGLHIDPDLVRAVNEKIVGPGVKRKNKCIINTGDKVTGAEVAVRLEANRQKYGIPEDIWQRIELPNPTVGPKPASTKPTKKATADDMKRAKDLKRRNKLAILAAYETDCDEPFTSESDTDADADNTDTLLEANDIDTIDARIEELRKQLAKKHSRRIQVRAKRLEKVKQEEQKEIELKRRDQKETEKVMKRKATTSLLNKLTDRPKKSKTTTKPERKSESKEKDVKSAPKATEAKTNKAGYAAADMTYSSSAEMYTENDLLEYDEACICRGSNTTDPNWISCDICETWFHWQCMEITVEPDEDFPWLCPTC
ncbi:hypothetical protein SARC_00591 [Sphaeroforma arctica JP610]|uniref:PHD-type domain-containing protein n=1 Tax=Sphaeroforma arctica JP610 TaxID=667725 RepID=A0A0L0GE11_9EUKA|nr:hypothetical protein SARC_00591 [Sphaeroforma arctica JP610]KNC87262.1 hypothetical protein SARC_00591 [Sphaeroforma arctica JP610]|eukprot:XP_014161164.1 hypothetical protein SARC_00591 [Sphaeroforma arctica JP610]